MKVHERRKTEKSKEFKEVCIIPKRFNGYYEVMGLTEIKEDGTEVWSLVFRSRLLSEARRFAESM